MAAETLGSEALHKLAGKVALIRDLRGLKDEIEKFKHA